MWRGHEGACHKSVDFLKHRTYLTGMRDPDATLDARGLLCPLPVLKARKRLQALEAGQLLRMTADDPAAVVDVPHYCNEAGHQLLAQSDANGVLTFDIQKA